MLDIIDTQIICKYRIIANWLLQLYSVSITKIKKILSSHMSFQLSKKKQRRTYGSLGKIAGIIYIKGNFKVWHIRAKCETQKVGL